jgi:hypothetical protein
MHLLFVQYKKQSATNYSLRKQKEEKKERTKYIKKNKPKQSSYILYI